jgi:hypothetical protein
MAITKVYLVGDETAPRTNSWLQVTNCLKTAEQSLAAIRGGTLKCVLASPSSTVSLWATTRPLRNVGEPKTKGDKAP